MAINNSHLETGSTNINQLKITHWNCRSLSNKIAPLIALILDEQPDIICLNELQVTTSLANKLLNSIKNSTGHNGISECRCFKTVHHRKVGGGVAMLLNPRPNYN